MVAAPRYGASISQLSGALIGTIDRDHAPHDGQMHFQSPRQLVLSCCLGIIFVLFNIFVVYDPSRQEDGNLISLMCMFWVILWPFRLLLLFL